MSVLLLRELGKTRIFVARLISLIVNDHYSMDQFLVLTFTKAAGNEMKQRLNVSLHEEALANHDEENIQTYSRPDSITASCLYHYI